MLFHETEKKATNHTIDNFQAVNQLSASFVELVSKLLIERNFFQNYNIPPETLVYLCHDLTRILRLETHKEDNRVVLDVVTELRILFNQLRCIPLTTEDEAYNNADKRIDVISEISKGLQYSAIALLGTSLFSSVTNAISQGLWSYVPWVAGYFSAATLGPTIIQYVVKRVLDNSSFTEEQKNTIQPWLNTIARLVALGFIPKVTATDKGVHVHYPNLNGHSETISRNQTVSLNGDDLTIEQQGVFETPDGDFDATHITKYKLSGINEITEQTVKMTILTPEGNEVPVVFHKQVGAFGPEITISSPDKNLEAYWEQFFQAQSEAATVAEPLGIMPTACKTAITAPSVVSQIRVLTRFLRKCGIRLYPTSYKALICIFASCRSENRMISGHLFS